MVTINGVFKLLKTNNEINGSRMTFPIRMRCDKVRIRIRVSTCYFRTLWSLVLNPSRVKELKTHENPRAYEAMQRFPPPSLTCQLEQTHSIFEVAVGSLRDKGHCTGFWPRKQPSHFQLDALYKLQTLFPQGKGKPSSPYFSQILLIQAGCSGTHL